MPVDRSTKDLASNETNCEIAGVVDYCKNFDGYMTTTTIDQEGCEERCAAYLIPNDMLSKDELATRIKSGYFDENGDICFMRDQHIHYCRKHLGTLGGAYMSQCSENPGCTIMSSIRLICSTPKRSTAIPKQSTPLRRVAALSAAMQVVISKYLFFSFPHVFSVSPHHGHLCRCEHSRDHSLLLLHPPLGYLSLFPLDEATGRFFLRPHSRVFLSLSLLLSAKPTRAAPTAFSPSPNCFTCSRRSSPRAFASFY